MQRLSIHPGLHRPVSAGFTFNLPKAVPLSSMDSVSLSSIKPSKASVSTSLRFQGQGMSGLERLVANMGALTLGVGVPLGIYQTPIINQLPDNIKAIGAAISFFIGVLMGVAANHQT